LENWIFFFQINIIGNEVETLSSSRPRPIIMTELDALLHGIERAYERCSKHLPVNIKPCVKAYTDSQVALWFIRRGTARYSWDGADLVDIVLRWNSLRQCICVDVEYVQSEMNPADFYTRNGLKCSTLDKFLLI
jgi:hypothetical protein